MGFLSKEGFCSCFGDKRGLFGRQLVGGHSSQASKLISAFRHILRASLRLREWQEKIAATDSLQSHICICRTACCRFA